MLPTYEAVLQPDGQLLFLDDPGVASTAPRHVLVTFSNETVGAGMAHCGATLSEAALTTDWLRDEEEAAWTHLQTGK